MPEIKITRRTLLRSAAVALAAVRPGPAAAAQFRIGVTDWNLKLGAKPEAVTLAAQLGFDGVQVRDRIFFDLLDDQVNLVHIKHDEKKYDLVFKPGDEFKAISSTTPSVK